MCGGRTVHINGGGRGGDRSKIIAHHEGIIPIVLGLIYILDHITVTRRPCDGLTILVPLIGQILPLGLGKQGDGLPAKDQTWCLWGVGNFGF